MMNRARLELYKALLAKNPILSGEARMAITELCAEIERPWAERGAEEGR